MPSCVQSAYVIIYIVVGFKYFPRVYHAVRYRENRSVYLNTITNGEFSGIICILNASLHLFDVMH